MQKALMDKTSVNKIPILSNSGIANKDVVSNLLNFVESYILLQYLWQYHI